MTGSSDTACLGGAGSRLALCWGLGAVPPWLHCRSRPLVQQAYAGAPRSPQSRGEAGKGQVEGQSASAPHTGHEL